MKRQLVLRVAGRAASFLFFIIGTIIAQALRVSFSKAARQRRARAEWLQRTAQRCVQILRLKINRFGALPTSGLVVANHLSYIDIILLAAQRPCVFVSKSEVHSWPIFGQCARLGGTIFVDRKHRGDVAGVTDLMGAALDEGALVILFPEGTSSGGASVLPFKSSLLEPALHVNHPVTAIAIAYALEQGSVANEICYWRDMTLLPHLLNVWSKSLIYCSLRCGVGRQRRGDRKSLARELHDEVAALHAASTRELAVRIPQTFEQPRPVLMGGLPSAAKPQRP
ncbi:phospholipid/glycerol acyltransferase [Chthoniobacter flavus Ellin428]|uniref:Phospholipid/glycerol acyltransferase n=1 Tax=Chthoniobacter flavus Ellin428 TaxID=497964 RepID=B4DBR7_9BACT|nr:lysophospholipid acyltransferase family protein [Chthoniobacter flavus]EDY16096.1 phospholipid/glycerol acyltransferase [Chthoniobacter flavus Ellin428]TCO83951.1 lyso-ornithine lipid acyltransferase [Chthoniobacter flavus]